MLLDGLHTHTVCFLYIEFSLSFHAIDTLKSLTAMNLAVREIFAFLCGCLAKTQLLFFQRVQVLKEFDCAALYITVRKQVSGSTWQS